MFDKEVVRLPMTWLKYDCWNTMSIQTESGGFSVHGRTSNKKYLPPCGLCYGTWWRRFIKCLIENLAIAENTATNIDTE